MTTSPLRCAHVGVGNRGAEILEMTMKYGCEPIVLVDTNPELLEVARQCANLPANACFTDLHAALQTPGLQACIITSPARFHASQIHVAIDHGLHVFVAKPLTYDLDEAQRLVKAAEDRNVILLVDQQSQFMLTERTAAHWMREQRFGEVGYGSFTIHRCRPEMRSFTGADPFLWE